MAQVVKGLRASLLKRVLSYERAIPVTMCLETFLTDFVKEPACLPPSASVGDELLQPIERGTVGCNGSEELDELQNLRTRKHASRVQKTRPLQGVCLEGCMGERRASPLQCA